MRLSCGVGSFGSFILSQGKIEVKGLWVSCEGLERSHMMCIRWADGWNGLEIHGLE